MRRGSDSSPRQLLAVAFAVMMLLSMGGVAFVGGAGAQTGGTADEAIDEAASVSVGNQVNIASDDLRKVGATSSIAEDQTVGADGTLTIDSDNVGSGEFGGVAIAPERIANLTGESYNEDTPLSFLENTVTTFEAFNDDTGPLDASDDDAYTAVFIEYAPQSNISQATGVGGADDYVFIVKDQSDGDVSAYSVDNGDSPTGNQIGSSVSTFGDAFTELRDAGLSDDNLENARLVVGTGLSDVHGGSSSGTQTVTEVQLTGPNGNFDATGETIHSEKIALDNPSSDTAFFSSISDAQSEAAEDAQITVDRGDYDDLAKISTSELTITTTDRTDGDLGPVDRVAGVGLADADNETVISSQVTFAQDAADVTLEGVVIQDGSNPAVEIAGSGVNNITLRNVVVDYSGSDTAVDFNPGDGVGTITDSAILANDPSVGNDDDTGLNLNNANVNDDAGITLTGNLIVGFETQVDGNDNLDIVGEVLEPNLFGNTSIDPAAQAAVVADAEIADGGTLQNANIFGSLDAADEQATDGDVIDVFSGEYQEDLDGTLTTDNVSIIGDTNAVLNSDTGSAVDFSDTNTELTLRNFTVAAGDDVTVTGTAPDNAVTLTDLTFAAGSGVLSVDSDSLGTDANVTVDAITFDGLDAGSAAVTVDVPDAGDVAVTDVDVDADNSGARALNLNGESSPVTVDSLTVTGVFIDSDSDTTLTGVDAIGIDIDGSTDDITISNNTVLIGGDATGLSLSEDAGNFQLTDNELRGGASASSASFTGIEIIDMSSNNANIDGNVITGETVANGVGIDATDNSGDGAEGSNTLGNALAGNQNAITGFEKLIDSDMSRSSTEDVIESSEASFGTYVDVFDEDASEYPEGADAGTLFGSVSTAVNAAPTDANLTITATDTAVDTTGFDSLEGGAITVDSYDHGDGATATLPSTSPSITLTSAGDAFGDAPLIEELAIEIAGGNDALGNHDVRNLRIENDEVGSTVIKADGTSDPLNAQSTIANLNVTTDSTGVEILSQNDDVAVIEIRDSSFDVGADGIVLAASADDRDGFVIDNVTLAGPGIATGGSTGLDLSDVDKPGKAELPTELEVREVSVRDFETQLQLSSDLVTNFDALDAEAVFENDVGSLDAGDANVVFEDNEFLQAVLVSAEVTLDDSTEERLADATTIYGSIDEADAEGVNAVDAGPVDLAGADDVDTVDTAIIDVRTGPADAFPDDRTFSTDEVVYEEPVSLGEVDAAGDDADNLLVRGPQAGVDANASFRDGGEAVILGASDLDNGNAGTYTDITVDGFTIVGDSDGDGDAVAVNAAPTTVNLNNTAVSAFDADDRANGVAITVDTDVALNGSFVGNHDNAVAVNNGVIVDDSSASLTVEADSLINDGEATGIDLQAIDVVSATINGDVTNFQTGVTVADATSVTITSNITGHSGGGVNVTSGADLTATGASISDNGAAGVFVDSDSATVDVDQSTVTNNSDDAGIQLAAVADTATHNITRTTFSGNGVGVDADTSGDATENVTLRGNAFTGARAIDSTETIDGTLNFFGDRNGPAAAAGASVTETVVYDPFLTADETTTALADIESTTGFAHDVVVPAGEGDRNFVAVGFPAQLEGVGADDTTTVDDYIDDSYEGNVYAFFEGNNSFSSVSGDTEIEAFDALVVENADDEDRVVSLEYAADRSPNAITDNRLTYDRGLNFVAPQQAGQVDEVLFAGGDTDAVVQPFAAGENLYGATSADQVRDQFVTPDGAQAVSTNFRSGAGDATVHPHVGYFVIVNDGTNDGLTTTEGIPVPDSPTAQNVDERTDSVAAITNTDSGETFDNLLTADRNAEPGDTLVLSGGNISVGSTDVRDSVNVTTSDLTIRGAGSAVTTVNGDLEVGGTNTVISDFTVVGEVTHSGANTQHVRVNTIANSPGDVIITGSDVTVADAEVDGDLTLDTGVTSASVSDADVNGELEITEDDAGISVSNTVAGSTNFVGGTSNLNLNDVSTRTVEVSTETELEDAASGSTSGVTFGPQTTVVVTDSLSAESDNALDNSIAITQPGLTITENSNDQTVGAGSTDVFDVQADNVAITDLTVEADSAAAIDLSGLTASKDVTIEDTTLDLTAGSGADVGINADGATLGTATIEDNTFEADGADAEEFVSDADDQLDLATIFEENDFPNGAALAADAGVIDTTVQSAENAAGPDETVVVSAGTFDESVTVDTEGLTLEGADGAEPSIEQDGDTIVTVTADDVTVDGLTLQQQTAGADNGIRLEADGFTLEDSTVLDVRRGLVDENSVDTEDLVVRDTVFDVTTDEGYSFGDGAEGTAKDPDTRTGIFLQDAPEALIDDVTVSGYVAAVAIEDPDDGSPDVTVQDSTFDENRDGVSASPDDAENRPTIEGNTFKNTDVQYLSADGLDTDEVIELNDFEVDDDVIDATGQYDGFDPTPIVNDSGDIVPTDGSEADD